MAHTPGPWRIPTPRMGFSHIEGPKGELIFGLAAGSIDEKQDDDVCEANVALIVLAPLLPKLVAGYHAALLAEMNDRRTKAADRAGLMLAGTIFRMVLTDLGISPDLGIDT
jgi:hypothetical protein